MESNVSIIPNFEASKAEVVLRDVETLKSALVPLAERAKTIVVHTPEQYAEAGALLKQIRDNRKQGEELVKPIARVLQNIKDWIQTVKLSHQNQCEQTEGVLEGKMVDFKRREREAAAAEERRINEENQRKARESAEEQRKRDEAAAAEARKQREKELAEQAKQGEIKKRELAKKMKQAEEDEKIARRVAELDANRMAESAQAIKVEPTTPKVAGLRQRIEWEFKIVDISLIPKPFLYPNPGPDGKYKPADFPQIGKFVRNAKDKKLSEATIPGIIVEWKDAV